MSPEAVSERKAWRRFVEQERKRALAAQMTYSLMEMCATPEQRPAVVEGPAHSEVDPHTMREFFNGLSPTFCRNGLPVG